MTVFLGLALAATTGSLVFAAVMHRALFHDGGFWFFRVLNLGVPHFDRPHIRLADTLLQFPALGILKFAPERFEAAMAALDFAYSLHPIASLIACGAILQRAGRRGYVLFPLLSFATATMATMAFAVGVVPTTLSVFWPAFLLVVLPERRTRANLAALTLLLAMLAFLHEAAIGFYCLILWIAIRRAAKKRTADEYAVVAMTLAGIVWLAYLLLGPISGEADLFVESLTERSVFRLHAAVCLCGILGPLCVWYIFPAIQRRYTAAFLVCFMASATTASALNLLWVIFWNPVQVSLWHANSDRTIAFLFAAVIAAVAYLFLERNVSLEWKSSPIARVFAPSAAIILILGFGIDL